MISPNEKEKAKQFWDRSKNLLSEWPTLIQSLFKDTKTAMRTIPQQGSWERIIVYFVAAGLIACVAQMFIFGKFYPGGTASLIFHTLVSIVGGGFIFGAILHFMLSAFAKAPGYYRATYFSALLSISSPLAMLAGIIHPVFGLAVAFAGLYLIYHFAMEIGGLSKQKAAIFVICLLLLMMLLSLTLMPEPPTGFPNNLTKI